MPLPSPPFKVYRIPHLRHGIIQQRFISKDTFNSKGDLIMSHDHKVHVFYLPYHSEVASLIEQWNSCPLKFQLRYQHYGFCLPRFGMCVKSTTSIWFGISNRWNICIKETRLEIGVVPLTITPSGSEFLLSLSSTLSYAEVEAPV